MSLNFFTPDVFHTPQAKISGFILPIQVNLVDSNFALVPPNNGSRATDEANTPAWVPLRGAALYRKLATLSPPAPGMFFGTTVGLPGIWLPQWRARTRE